MIGQNKLIRKLNKINSLDELPKSIIIYGEDGSGKHTFANEIINKFNVKSEIIDYELTLDILNDMYALSIPRFYIIDMKSLQEHKRVERFQNTILKFIEEPPEFAWIIMLVSPSIDILETVYNRCQIFKISPYSINELRQIAHIEGKNYDDDTLRILRVPGNIVDDDIVYQINTISSLSNMMIDMLSKATPSNALSIDKKFFGDECLNIDLFFILTEKNLMDRYSSNFDNKYFKAFMLTHSIFRKLYILNVNKKDLLDNYLINLKEVLND